MMFGTNADSFDATVHVGPNSADLSSNFGSFSVGINVPDCDICGELSGNIPTVRTTRIYPTTKRTRTTTTAEMTTTSTTSAPITDPIAP